MTYFGFLLGFLVVPIAGLALLTARDLRSGRRLPTFFLQRPAWVTVLLHVIVAVLYTTPWDNYLVATGVWYYAPSLVTGVTLGWVPIEEYTFFVLQTLLTGLCLLWLARRPTIVASGAAGSHSVLRWASAVGLGAVWLGAVAVLASGWTPGTYLGLSVGWLVPPVILQLAAGAGLLWRERRLAGLAIAIPTVYLSIADGLAIASGTWTIAPGRSTGILLGGVLPVEELLFFLMTNTLIVFGMLLFMSLELPASVKRGFERIGI